MPLAPCLPRNRANRQRRIAQALALLPDSATMVARIEATLALATTEESVDGAAWYASAGDLAKVIGAAHNRDKLAGSGIIAALSPQCSWTENVDRALRHADGDSVGAMADPLRKADAIAGGADVWSTLGGRKVRSFARNIDGHGHYVTVDRHAVAIVYGRALNDREIKVLDRIGPYAIIAAAYRTVARRHNLAPSTVQAITWLVWRRLKGDDDLGEF